MLKKFILCFLVAASVYGCKKNTPVKSDPDIIIKTPDTAAITAVVIEAAKNQGKVAVDINATINGDEITALIPSVDNNKKFIVTFTTKTPGTEVKVSDTVQISGTTVTDFTKPVTYSLTTPKGTTKTYKFTLKNFTGIPIFYITTSSPVVSKDDYVTGSVIINTNAQFEQEKNNITLKIKGRGNSTWGMPKKPYRLKFDNKASVLDLPAAKNWVLLANYSDKTLLRTSIAFDLGNKLGANFTPKGRHVEVVMNGVYLGNYLLTYQTEVHENRIDIKEMDPDDESAEKITGGYLLEQDERLDEAFWFRTKKNIPFTIKSPEEITPAQLSYIKGYIQQTEDAIFAANFTDPENGYARYINPESFINWYLVQELTKNQDAKDFSSIYYFKDRGGKLNMGPLWDFDLAIGNVNYSAATNATGWWIKDGAWFKRLFEDPAFRAKVKTRWNAIKNTHIAGITHTIDSTASYINLSQKQNFTKWPILDKYVWPNPVILGTYDKEIDRVKTWLAQRAAWMDGEISRY